MRLPQIRCTAILETRETDWRRARRAAPHDWPGADRRDSMRNPGFMKSDPGRVIDPTLVVRSALQDATSVAGLLLTTEAAIVEA
jgi:hypothetical protein